MYLTNFIFLLAFLAGVGLFAFNFRKIVRNIQLGRDVDRSDQKPERWKTMLRVAFGQSKMVKRPVAGALHIMVYVGFVIINIELLEIVLDGILGTHRIFAPLGSVYNVLIASFEVLAGLVIVAVILFWTRRNVVRLARFWSPEMKGWPKNDANLILYIELVLMLAFLNMNAADLELQQRGVDHYVAAGSFPVSQYFQGLYAGLSTAQVIFWERFFWWFHILGILSFLNYLYYSKHLHIILAFPNTYFSKLEAKGEFNNLESVTAEVKLMMDPSADPFAAAPEGEELGEPERFGARDVIDLNKMQLLNAYTCTECGRCTSVCPANLTGKALSPRKIMMDVRDRAEELGRWIDRKKTVEENENVLLDNYITREELWACTTCNACTEACPVLIDPMSIIVDMRRYLVMEESAAPQELNLMMTNMENNGAPWQFSQMDRLNWKDE